MPPFTIRFSDATDYPPSSGAVSGSIIGARMADAGTPYVLGGVTLQTLVESAMGAGASNGWTSGDDIRLRGRWRRTNGSAALGIAITPPDGPGEYEVSLGGAANNYQRSRWRINDGVDGTNRLDASWVSEGAFWGTGDAENPARNHDQWIDQRGVVRPIGANALVVVPSVITLSTGVLHLVNGHGSGALSSDLSFIHIARVGAPPAGTGRAARMMYTLLT